MSVESRGARLLRARLTSSGSKRFVKRGARNEMEPEDVGAIARAVATGIDPNGEVGVELSLVALDEIAANDWDLYIGRYVRGHANIEASRV